MHSRTWRRLTLGVALVALMAAPAWCDVPRFADVVGHEFGERITVHHQMVAYLEALHQASPRVTVVDQGTSWEGRRLLLAIVTSPANEASRAVARSEISMRFPTGSRRSSTSNQVSSPSDASL